jgi:chitin disaccharide deacetylase
VGSPRYLIVVADDYGIGPETSRGILELGRRGAVTGTVLLVNSPHAEADVAAWRRAGGLPQLGWHPCLTLDAPLLPPGRVPSLVGPDGRFFRLGQLLQRLLRRHVRPEDVAAELRAQLRRFHDLVGSPPGLVNAHHHVQVFPPVGAILENLLAVQRPLPYFRRVREPWRLLATVPGARGKRTFLSLLGRRAAQRLARAGFPGADWHAGITNPPCVADPDFFTRWLRKTPGRVVELCCHPGYFDATLVGRDCTVEDGQQRRRVREQELLRQPNFLEACRGAGFILTAASDLRRGESADAA